MPQIESHPLYLGTGYDAEHNGQRWAFGSLRTGVSTVVESRGLLIVHFEGENVHAFDWEHAEQAFGLAQALVAEDPEDIG